MAFPSTSGAAMLARALQEAQDRAASVKRQAQSNRDRSAAGGILALAIVEFQQDLIAGLARLNIVKVTPGLAAYAKVQFDTPGLDIAAEFTAMTAAMQDVLDWIAANLPVSAGGFIEERKIEADGSTTNKSFTVGQTAGFRTELDALIATID